MPDLWPGIAQRIAAMGGSRRYTFSLPQLAAAGIALMVFSGGAVWMLRQQTVEPAAREQAAAVDNPTVVPVNLADASYDEAVADLQRALEVGRSRLDPRRSKCSRQPGLYRSGHRSVAARAVGGSRRTHISTATSPRRGSASSRCSAASSALADVEG